MDLYLIHKKTREYIQEDAPMIKRILLFLVILGPFLASCAPVISDKSIMDSDRSIPFLAVLKDPGTYTGKTIILGGRIISVTIREGETKLELIEQPLNDQYKPVSKDISQGRYLVIYKGFLDPAIYSRGRLITVVGQIRGGELIRIGDVQYSCPVLVAKELYLLPRRSGMSDPAINFGIGFGVGTIR